MGAEVLGKRLNALMKYKGFSQGYVAKETGISQARLSNILNGKGGSVGIDIVEKLCFCLDVTPDFLIGFPVSKIKHYGYSSAKASAYTGLPFETVEALGWDSVPYFSEFLTAELVRSAEEHLLHIANDASRLCAYREGEAFKGIMIAAGLEVKDYEKEFDDSTWGAVHKLEMLLRNRIEEFAQAYLTHQGRKSDQLINRGRNNGNDPQENK